MEHEENKAPPEDTILPNARGGQDNGPQVALILNTTIKETIPHLNATGHNRTLHLYCTQDNTQIFCMPTKDLNDTQKAL